MRQRTLIAPRFTRVLTDDEALCLTWVVVKTTGASLADGKIQSLAQLVEGGSLKPESFANLRSLTGFWAHRRDEVFPEEWQSLHIAKAILAMLDREGVTYSAHKTEHLPKSAYLRSRRIAELQNNGTYVNTVGRTIELSKLGDLKPLWSALRAVDEAVERCAEAEVALRVSVVDTSRPAPIEFPDPRAIVVVPSIGGIDVDVSSDGRLRIAQSPTPPALPCPANLQADVDTFDRSPPFLKFVGYSAGAVFELPDDEGITLSALWPTLSDAERALVALRVVQCVASAGPVSLLPRASVLCGQSGNIWLVPPLPTSIKSASRTWGEQTHQEYCVAFDTSRIAWSMAATLLRLVAGAPPNVVLAPTAAGVTQYVSQLPTELGPLLLLIPPAILDGSKPSQRTARNLARWHTVLASTEAEIREQAGVGLEQLVRRAKPLVSIEHQW